MSKFHLIWRNRALIRHMHVVALGGGGREVVSYSGGSLAGIHDKDGLFECSGEGRFSLLDGRGQSMLSDLG